MTTTTMKSGSIQPRGQNTYRIFISAGVDAQGKRRRRSLTIKGSYQDAERLLKQLQHTDEALSLRLADWVARWLDHAEQTKAPTTVGNYRQMLTSRILPALGHYYLDQLQPRQLNQFLQQLALSPQQRRAGLISGHTQLKYYRLLFTLLQDAVSQELLTENPLQRVRPPKIVHVWGADA